MGDAPAASTEGLNFDLPDEIRMLKDTVRKFVDKELIPIERKALSSSSRSRGPSRASSTSARRWANGVLSSWLASATKLRSRSRAVSNVQSTQSARS